jgi:hypothetical protein
VTYHSLQLPWNLEAIQEKDLPLTKRKEEVTHLGHDLVKIMSLIWTLSRTIMFQLTAKRKESLSNPRTTIAPANIPVLNPQSKHLSDKSTLRNSKPIPRCTRTRKSSSNTYLVWLFLPSCQSRIRTLIRAMHIKNNIRKAAEITNRFSTTKITIRDTLQYLTVSIRNRL